MKNKVFISYSHKDKKFLDELRAHLKLLDRAGRVTAWSDRQLVAGENRLETIKAELSSASVAVLLVSKDFLSSDFVHEHELGPLLAEAERGGVRVLWVMIRACAYHETPLRLYEPVRPPDEPLAEMRGRRDRAWVEICEKIVEAAENP